MQRRFNSVEDFEVAVKDILNQKKLYWECEIHAFGFCWFCKEITKHDYEYGRGGQLVITCIKCEKKFGAMDGAEYNPQDMYWLIDDYDEDIPTGVHGKIKHLQSREVQKEFLLELLDKFLAEKISSSQKLQREIERLRLLRPKLRRGK